MIGDTRSGVRARARVIASALALASLAACSTDETIRTPDPHLNRMLEQPKVLPYDEDPRTPGVAGMLAPPPFTIARGAPVDDEARAHGTTNGEPVTKIPIPVTHALLARGRAAFDTTCAVCHGVLGDGQSVVAEKMQLRPPPPITEARFANEAPGKTFRTITLGYGLMPSYAAPLSIDDRWAVVAYVEALRASRHTTLADLPEPLRADALGKLSGGAR